MINFIKKLKKKDKRQKKLLIVFFYKCSTLLLIYVLTSYCIHTLDYNPETTIILAIIGIIVSDILGVCKYVQKH